METEEKLCIKVLRTLQQMLVKRNRYGERVSTTVPWRVPSPAAPHPRGSALAARPRPAPARTLTTFICLGRATCCGKCS